MWRRMLDLWRTWRGTRPAGAPHFRPDDVPRRPWHAAADPDVPSAAEFDPAATLSPAMFARLMREAGLG